MSYGSDFVLTLFTNDIELAKRADDAGVNRIGLELEKIGKAERQARLKAWVSDHEQTELPALRKALQQAQLFVRTNPIHPGSREEIESLINEGVEVLMLPMFTTIDEAATFIELIAGRAEVSLLVETAQSAVRLEEIVTLEEIDEVHIGLNDLHLSLGLRNHFELLRFKFMQLLSGIVSGAGIPFGFGGVGRVKDDRLPVPPDLIYAQYPLLGADRALMSRVFVSPDYTKLDLKKEVAAFRKRMNDWYARPEKDAIEAREDLWNIASTFQ